MLKFSIAAAVLFSSLTFSSLSAPETQTAEACGLKIPARVPKISRATASNNKSNILVIGKRDSALIRQLKLARHKVTYASSVTDAKKGRYKVVIVDSANWDDAKGEFGNATMVRAANRGTARQVETVLARRASSTSITRVASANSKTDKKITATGRERVTTARTPTAVGGEAAKPKPVASASEPAPTPVRATPEPVAKPAPKPTPVVAVSKPKPKPVVRERAPVREPRVATERAPKVRTAKWSSEMFFGTNKSSLNAAAQRRLKANASWLAQNPSATLTIEGHTDSVGDEAYNLDLSERRAQFAADFLIGLGVDESRINVEAKGEQEPAYKPTTSRRNRRIVFSKN